MQVAGWRYAQRGWMLLSGAVVLLGCSAFFRLERGAGELGGQCEVTHRRRGSLGDVADPLQSSVCTVVEPVTSVSKPIGPELVIGSAQSVDNSGHDVWGRTGNAIRRSDAYATISQFPNDPARTIRVRTSSPATLNTPS